MCGIIGWVGNELFLETFGRIVDTLEHRGPDDTGSVIPEPGVFLGHKRLSILDLSPSGKQPMTNDDNSIWITYNGEIYNFLELRGELEKKGYRFRSRTDTEVILRGYEEWGKDVLPRLNGMFAFGIWDIRKRRLFLARDRMGIKPLYYYNHPEAGFIFSSEVRTLLASGVVPKDLSHEGLYAYLQSGSLEDPLTLIEGVRALLPGHYLIWEAGQIKEIEYWDVPLFDASAARAADEQVDLKKLYEEIGGLLGEVMRQHLLSDVPVAAFLSGGIDSSAVTALMREVGDGQAPHTFSVVFGSRAFDESPFSRTVAKQFTTRHTEIHLTEDEVLQHIDAAVAAYDQPSIDGVNTYFIARAVRQAGLKVALSGLGGDEVFAGYTSARRVPQMEYIEQCMDRFPGKMRRGFTSFFAGVVTRTERNRKLAALFSGEASTGSLPHPYFLARAVFMPAQMCALLGPEVYGQLADQIAENEIGSRRRTMLARAAKTDSVNRALYLEARNYMANTLLRDTDAMSMAHGLEVRVPLIDHRLVERIFALPGSLKVDDATPKHLLVRSLPCSLPSLVVNRRKMGFTFPWEIWLRSGLRPRVEACLHGSNGYLSGILDSTALRGLWSDFERGRCAWSRVWAVYVLEEWIKAHLSSN